MSARLRSCAAVLLAAGLLGLLAAPLLGVAPARAKPRPAATSCTSGTVAQHVRSAAAVFTGTVTKADRLPSTRPVKGTAKFDNTVTVERVYQGAVTTDAVSVVTNKATGTCALGKLTVGGDYVFLVAASGDRWVATGAGGTAVRSGTLVHQIERLLGDGRAPVATRPEPATFTRVAGSTPIRVTRLVAPGVALVIVGLLGLLVVRRVSR